MICPIMANGWLSNKYAASKSAGKNSTFRIENFPKCVEENCALWEINKCGFRLTNHSTRIEKDRSD